LWCPRHGVSRSLSRRQQKRLKHQMRGPHAACGLTMYKVWHTYMLHVMFDVLF
jgi:hypothetical protein